MSVNSLNSVFMLLGPLLTQSPLWIVWIIGIIIAIRRWHQCPRASVLTLISIAMLFFISVVTTVVYRLIPRFMDPGEIGVAFMIVGVVAAFVHAIAWACLLVAVFTGRGERGADSVAFETRGHGQNPLPDEEAGNPFQSRTG